MTAADDDRKALIQTIEWQVAEMVKAIAAVGQRILRISDQEILAACNVYSGDLRDWMCEHLEHERERQQRFGDTDVGSSIPGLAGRAGGKYREAGRADEHGDPDRNEAEQGS